MYCTDVGTEWRHIHPEDLWVYNKLILSTRLGYTCGPAGLVVPYPGSYVVRPCMNLLGMGRFARIEFISRTTEHLHPAEFWCEKFFGEHISVDFHKKKADLVVKGTKDVQNPLYKWEKWEKIDKNVNFPEILQNLVGNYEWINCEFIGNSLIEVHFRRNPDFRHGNSVALPVWDDENLENADNYSYINDPDYKRKGFFVK